MKKTLVLKCGGSILNQLSSEFFRSVKQMADENWNIVIVHGGGPDINSLLSELNIESEFFEGQRKTTPEILEVVEMTLAGKLNKKLVRKLSEAQLNAVGITGQDGGLLTAEFLSREHLGFVGRVTSVQTEILQMLLDKGFIPVVAPLARTEDYQALNVNADLAASAIARALQADKLLYVTDVKGILQEKKLVDEINPEEINGLIEKGVITGGMIPKAKAASGSLSEHLKQVMIVSGKQTFFKEGKFIGTKVCKQKEAAEK
ncbi:acetylglutamate kinase [Metabacillus sp. RGM 3146]|uniref:acetylglutamate kinase n=1 Tax=Metabacillus sp. RGM 3146 TaxID=3401092 RepID=UPI003B99E944